jgi:hypothetical protein
MNDDALDMLTELLAVGLVLTREGESLRARPSSKLTATRQHVILAHKQELLAALDAQRLARDAISAAAAGKRQVR